ncbi:MAG: MnhB domain-containing protein [archaeon]
MIILRTIGRIMFPFILVMGVAMGAYGHLTPGGAFPAGVIVATAFLLYYITQAGSLPGDLGAKLSDEYNVSSAGVMGIMLVVLSGLVILMVRPELAIRYPGELFSALTVFGPNTWGILSIGLELIVLILCFMPKEQEK